MECRCIRKCWYNKNLYRVGDTANITDQVVPRHFITVKQFSDELVRKTAEQDRLANKVVKKLVKPQKAE